MISFLQMHDLHIQPLNNLIHSTQCSNPILASYKEYFDLPQAQVKISCTKHHEKLHKQTLTMFYADDIIFHCHSKCATLER